MMTKKFKGYAKPMPKKGEVPEGMGPWLAGTSVVFLGGVGYMVYALVQKIRNKPIFPFYLFDKSATKTEDLKPGTDQPVKPHPPVWQPIPGTPDSEYPTYANETYFTMADKIKEAGFGPGTNEQTIYSVIDMLKKDSDVVALTNAFSEVTSEELGNYLRSELDDSEMSKINSMLAANSIRARF